MNVSGLPITKEEKYGINCRTTDALCCVVCMPCIDGCANGGAMWCVGLCSEQAKRIAGAERHSAKALWNANPQRMLSLYHLFCCGSAFFHSDGVVLLCLCGLGL